MSNKSKCPSKADLEELQYPKEYTIYFEIDFYGDVHIYFYYIALFST